MQYNHRKKKDSNTFFCPSDYKNGICTVKTADDLQGRYYYALIASTENNMYSSKLQAKVWDLPLRLFHWLLVLVFAGLWYTGENAGLERHFLLGKMMLGLLVFRLLWGIIGSQTARFSQLPLHPKSALRYLKGRYGESTGHNPLGSWSVVLILSLLCLQVVTGLFTNDGVMDEGPLVQYISTNLSDQLTSIHHLSFNALLWVLGLHITAVMFYQFIKKQALINAMFTGKKSLADDIKAPVMAHPFAAVVCAAIAVLAAYGIHSL